MAIIGLVNDEDGTNKTLEDILGLDSVATSATPATFIPNNNRGGVAISPGPLPSNPTPGTLAVDSEDNNTFKWWSGSVWINAGSPVLGLNFSIKQNSMYLNLVT